MSVENPQYYKKCYANTAFYLRGRVKTIDAFCGGGDGAAHMSSVFANTPIFAIDSDTEAVARAVDAYEDNHSIKFLGAPIAATLAAFRSHEFGNATLFKLPNDLTEVENLVREIARILTVRGIMCLSFPKEQFALKDIRPILEKYFTIKALRELNYCEGGNYYFALSRTAGSISPLTKVDEPVSFYGNEAKMEVLNGREQIPEPDGEVICPLAKEAVEEETEQDLVDNMDKELERAQSEVVEATPEPEPEPEPEADPILEEPAEDVTEPEPVAPEPDPEPEAPQIDYDDIASGLVGMTTQQINSKIRKYSKEERAKIRHRIKDLQG